jgi:SAM-dependent methyltransferase
MVAGGELMAASVEEPLRELARFSFDFAPHFCDPAHGCVAYHRGWSMVRLLESGGKLPAGQDFFRRELLDLAAERGTGRLRVMLSGAADTGQAALVLQSLRPHGIEPEFVIVDRCRTTLEQQGLFLRLRGVTAEYHQADAVEVSVAPVDAIIAHSFITFIPETRRQALFANWNRNLAPGGRVLLSERFLQAGVAPRRPISPDERKARLSRILASLESEGTTGQERQKVVAAVEGLWDQSGKRPKMPAGLFRENLAAAGLAILREAADYGQENLSPIATKDAPELHPRIEAVLVRAP